MSQNKNTQTEENKMFKRLILKHKIRKETKRQFKAIMDSLTANPNAPLRELREDEKLMLDLARLQLHTQIKEELNNARA